MITYACTSRTYPCETDLLGVYFASQKSTESNGYSLFAQPQKYANLSSMNTATAEIQKMSPTEYLVMERASLVKHQYMDGEVFAMAGGSRAHNLLVANLITEIRNQFRNRPCEVYPSDMRVKITTTGLYTYPDVVIACPPEFEDEHGDTLLNPCIIFEILSPSTEGYDRGKKFEHYRRIESLQSYILISQEEILVEHFSRHKDRNRWWLTEFRAGSILQLETINCEISLEEMYLKVFPSA